MKKWLKRLLIILPVVLVVVGGVLYYYFFHFIRMSNEMISNADKALSAGITLNDPEGDFQSMGGGDKPQSKGRPNNPEAYKLAYDDIKSLNVGMDDKYIYFKAVFWGNFPNKADKMPNGDPVQDVGIKLNITDDKGQDQAIMCPGIDLFPFGSTIGSYYFYEPTGIKEPEDKRFAHQDSDSKVAGGAGTNYLLSAYPLSKLNIKKGDTIYFSFSVEASSKKYDHASVDVLGGAWKQGDIFSWKTDTNQLSIQIKAEDQGQKK